MALGKDYFREMLKKKKKLSQKILQNPLEINVSLKTQC